VPVPDYTGSLVKDVKGLKIGIPKEYFVDGMNPEIRATVMNAVKTLADMGASQGQVSLPHSRYAVPVYYIIAAAETSSNMGRYDGVQFGYRSANKTRLTGNKLIDMYKHSRGEGFGEEAKRRILLGTFALSHGYYDAYYMRALKVRTLIKQDFEKVFSEYDCIITPTTPTAAFKIGEKSDNPLDMYLTDIYTNSVNLAGLPAVSIPCGFTKEGLPIGLQIIAKPFAEETLMRVAYTFEQTTQFHKQKPAM
jgi:aspartyl-tRNA(Asn)/glutamyl-tRNA(Gln) amidotransferase subunit A